MFRSEKVQNTQNSPETFTFIYKREIQPYYKHTLFGIVDNEDETNHANGPTEKLEDKCTN